LFNLVSRNEEDNEIVESRNYESKFDENELLSINDRAEEYTNFITPAEF
jgi:hypothetical protein